MHPLDLMTATLLMGKLGYRKVIHGDGVKEPELEVKQIQVRMEFVPGRTRPAPHIRQERDAY